MSIGPQLIPWRVRYKKNLSLVKGKVPMLVFEVITARVRSTREGNVLTRVCLSVHGGGYPYPIMLCNISQNAMGQLGGGYPARSSWGGTLAGGGVPWPGGYPGWGGTLAGGVPS